MKYKVGDLVGYRERGGAIVKILNIEFSYNYSYEYIILLNCGYFGITRQVGFTTAFDENSTNYLLGEVINSIEEFKAEIL